MPEIEIYNSLPLVSKEQVQKIMKRIPIYIEKKQRIGHSHSQASLSLQTLQMIDDSPLSRMKQCLTQIDRKYEALKEAHFECERLQLELKTLDSERESELIRINEITNKIPAIKSNMGNALRLLGMFQDMYSSIQKNYNIPDNWNEKDYEKQEYENMIRKACRLGVQDITAHNVPSKAVLEYWEQLGLNPLVMEYEVREYVTETKKQLFGDKNITVEQFYEFLDYMAIKYKDCYKFALKRIGLDEIGSEEFQA
tara:strand:- start:1067 stop:1825 length:759 start_codon:yes stop_codon:yes gene_type:complete